tara:strand:- start:10 stop:951 length:942 start_codon:yes stop_codon:yes gene_type:complete
MNINFTTYFDKNYESKFYCLFQSLKKQVSNFHIYAFVVNSVNKKNYNQADLENITFIYLNKLETRYPQLYYAKKNRTNIEYLFTLTPFTCKYLFDELKIKDVSYLDSDLYFFNNPNNLYNFIFKEKSEIFITKHENNKIEDKYGAYNVGWIMFKNSVVSRQCLSDWGDDCINWCFDKVEEGKYADQKYLDKWPTKYNKVSVINNFLINVGPWNCSKLNENNSNQLIAFHFHNIYIFMNIIIVTNISTFYDHRNFNKDLIRKIYLEYYKVYKLKLKKFKNFNSSNKRSVTIINKIIRFMKLIKAIVMLDFFLIK